MRRSSTVAAVVWVALSGCDGGGDADLGLRCASPASGEMVVAEAGQPVAVTIEIGAPDRIASLEVNGEAVTVDRSGSVELDVRARFGANHVLARAETTDGRTVDRLCTFLAAPAYQAPDAPLDEAVTMRLGPAAVDDADGDATELHSLADLFRRFLDSGAIESGLELYFLTGAPVKSMECDRVAADGVTCELETRLDYRGNDFGGIETLSLTPIEDGIAFDGRSRQVTLDVRLEGTVDPSGAATPISADGTLTFEYFEMAGEVDVLATDGRIEVPLRRLTNVMVGDITASFPSITDPTLRADVESEIVGYYVGSSGDSFTNGFAEYLLDNLSNIVEGLLRTLDVRTLGPEVEIPGLDGQITGLSFDSSFSSVAATPDGLTFGLGTRYGGAGGAARDTLGVPLAGAVARPATPRCRSATTCRRACSTSCCTATGRRAGSTGSWRPT